MSHKKNLAFTRSYIRLFEMQLHGVLHDMSKPAEEMSAEFSEALLKLYDIKEELASSNALDRDKLLDHMQGLIDQLFTCVSSMQFLDAKRQRLEHVSDGLSYLTENEIDNECDWAAIKNKIVQQYKMDKERKIYEKFLQQYAPEDLHNTVEKCMEGTK